MPGPGNKRIKPALAKFEKGSQFIKADESSLCSTGYLLYGADVLIRDLGIDNWLDIGTSIHLFLYVSACLPDKKKHIND